MKHWLVGMVAVCIPSAAAVAQAPQCTGQAQVQVRDACQLAVDLFQYMAPQLGTAVAGGNATLGQGGTLGGLGHFTVGVRANVVDGTLPQLDQVTPSTTGIPAPRQIPTTDHQPLPMPVVDAAIGVFKGFPLGLTNVGGVDLLLDAAYIPTVTTSEVSLRTPNGSLKFGYGVRLGLLQESFAIPGVSVTYLKRDLPKVTLASNSVSGATQDSLSIQDFSVATSAWRVVASKGFLFINLAAGVGQDKYSQSATISTTVRNSGITYGSGTFGVGQDVTRTNMFLDLSFNILMLKVVGEVGQVSGGTIPVYNNFSKEADASRLYGSLGLRLSF
ncbi:MAG TPA: hypothetical protein VFK16_08240 [Gemmatimonadaceae bacterium]|nr:hypothetical protein [Gemmatimonadaceae bacterium]